VRLSGWTVGYVVANQLALLFVLVLAATGSDGDVTAYQYAFIFFQLPHGLFAVSIMTTTTPELARHSARDDLPAMRDGFALGLRYLLLVVIPSSAALAVLAQPLVSILVRGGFDAADATVTADTLQAFALGLVPFSVYLFVLRGFYARQDTRTPFLVNVLENTTNVLLALALFPALGVRGLALGYGGAYAIGAVVALILLRRRIGEILPASVLATAGRAVLGSAVLGVAAALCAGAVGHETPAAAAAAVTVGVLAGGLAYVGVLAAIRSEELRGLARVIRRPRAPDADV
jgi:putative peptidoglycan lipid II flippase